MKLLNQSTSRTVPGGVGGLLAITDARQGSHFCAYDGNGNVTALVKADGSGLTAQYEYGPFGEVLRATGPMAKANLFRFSTKYQDGETDLLYYGYRYYN
ncbi:MAG TPA: RHS repeat protein, partial [Verrucomicrobiota bacterium]|nr:RHS repeat protein [Verrucomicrobiota bacterium]